MTSTTKTKRSRWEKLALWVGLAAILIIAALLLRLEGRLWMCACGTIRFWIGNTCSSDNSQHFLDPYAFTHVLHGFAFYWLIALVIPRLKSNWQLLLAIALEAAWEVFENTNFVMERYRTATAALGYNGDTVINSTGDILCCLVGFLIAKWLGFRRALIVFVALEVVLILWIRDSLLLEILMLTIPIESIKAWQLCA
ncbi:MAG TPA: DUF2585 family protein [Pyrinomonadaceae bacterium]|nr:DUF2585 family protein [Pyrinomonadaceae bacterium]